MDLVIVRHAEPVRVEAHETNGQPADPHLTERGHRQARRLADWLSHERYDAILVSPKLRAIETAMPVAAALSMPTIVVDGLIEYDSHADEYIPIEEMQAAGDPRFAAMVEGRWEEFGGEAPEIFRARISDTLDTIIDKYAGQRVLAVCHGGVVNVALAIVAGLDRHLWFRPDYTSISRVVASRSGIRSVQSINETGHLLGRREQA